MFKSFSNNTVIAPPEKNPRINSHEDTVKFLKRQGGILYLIWERLGGFHGVRNQVNTESRSNVDSNETILLQYKLNADSLSHQHAYINITAFGVFAANANNKRIRLYFGSSILIDTGSVAANSGSWTIESKIVRVASNSQKIITTIISNNSLITNGAHYKRGSENLKEDIIIKCTGTGVASNDIEQEVLILNMNN